MTVDPPGSLTPSTSVTVQFEIENSGLYPFGGEIRLFTDLDNPNWTYTIIVNGIENHRPVVGGHTLVISGFELSYRADDEVSVRATLEGTAPTVSSISDQVILQISDVDSAGHITTVYTDYYHQVALTDGGKIAFTSNRDGNYEIYTMNPDGAGQTRLTNNPAYDGFTSWSPDGMKIAFASERDGNFEIYVMNPDGTEQIRLTSNSEDDSDPAWSPDSSKIAFTSNQSGNNEIYVMNPDGTGQTRLTSNTASDGFPAWSPDSSKIAFTSNRDGNPEIYVMSPDGTGQTRITNNTAADVFSAWSPDSSKIAFASNRDGNDDEIYVMNADGTGQTRLTFNVEIDFDPAWSPDSLKIVFTSERDHNFEIYMMNPDGTGQTRLTTNMIYDGEPDWGQNKAPVANFTCFPSSGTAPLEVQFTDNSSNIPTAWNWSFGNISGNNTQVWFSTTQNPVHTFGAGNYSIVLNASNNAGYNLSTQVTFINVSASTLPLIPLPNFTTNVTTGNAPLTVQFNDTTIGWPEEWAWSFGDGNYSMEQNPVHTYAYAGHFMVQLRTSNRYGGGFTHRYIDVFSLPVANFTGTPSYGTAPLTVSFTDLSTNNPTGWAWYFGDENYETPWTHVNSSAGWSGRFSHSSVVMPDCSIVLMGGVSFNGLKNDTWRSTDNGTSWTPMNASSGWSARHYHSSVVLPDGSIELMGGNSPVGFFGRMNDVWRTTDSGATWTQVTESADWSAREGHSSVVMPDGSIVLMGGVSFNGLKNDTWRSTDNGATWTQINASSGWAARAGHSSVVMPDGSIVLMGGIFYNDTWRSTDNGATWKQMTASAGWTGRSIHSSVVMPDGSIVMLGGGDYNGYKNDTWRSTDNGATWTQVTPSAEWSKRGAHSSVVMPDGSIVLMGGTNTGNYDTWRFSPVGSSEHNPSHTYSTPGIYQVTLQAYNAGGYNNTRKTSYITVYPRGDSGSGSSDDTPSLTITPSYTITQTVNVGGGSAVTRAELTGTNLGKNLVITAFPQDDLPSTIAVPQTTVYQYISVTSSTILGVVSQTTLDFSIPKSWLTEHGFTAGDIVMMRNENGQWKTLETRFVSQNSGNALYRATTPGFSYFAIAYQKGGTDMGTGTPVVTPAPPVTAIAVVPVTDTDLPVPITTEKTQAVPPASVILSSEGIPLTTIIVAVLGVVTIIIGAFLIRRWWIRKQNPVLFRKNE